MSVDTDSPCPCGGPYPAGVCPGPHPRTNAWPTTLPADLGKQAAAAVAGDGTPNKLPGGRLPDVPGGGP